jgi:archaeal flagellar protein FlaI
MKNKHKKSQKKKSVKGNSSEMKRSADAKSIEKLYYSFQSTFIKSYNNAKKAKDRESVKGLEKIRDSVVKKVQAYNRNPNLAASLMSELRRDIGAAKNMSAKKRKEERKKVLAERRKDEDARKAKKRKEEHKRMMAERKKGGKIKLMEKKKRQRAAKAKAKVAGARHTRGARVSRPKPERRIERVAKEHNAAKLHVFKDKKHKEHKEVKHEPKGDMLETYPIEINKAKINVEIVREGAEIKYNVKAPEIHPATATLLNEVRNELITATTISMKELVNPESFLGIKERFMIEASDIIKKKLPRISRETEEFLIGRLIQDMLGLGKIEFLINDPHLEEVVLTSSKEPIKVYSKRYGWLTTNIKIDKEEHIVNYANIIARRVGRQINVLSPLLDAHLVGGDRINAVLYPINTKGNSMTIRKFARDPYTMIDLINNKTCDIDAVCIIWIATEYEMNIIISGGTASGKTSILNACMPFIPPNQRIISIEDTRELMLPEFLYWTPLVTRTPNPEGKGEVSMLHLLVNSLRMRPDRIILGEMRRHEEAMVLFEAMHTGHSVYATVHADSAPETISRLVNPPMSVPPNLLKSVNLNIVMFRDRRRGIRRMLQMAEFEASKDDAKANILFRWSAEDDKIVRHSESFRFYEDLGRHTGMTIPEINRNLEEKKKILQWLIKNNIRGLDEFGKIMNLYYRNKPLVLQAVSKNDPKLVLGARNLEGQKRVEYGISMGGKVEGPKETKPEENTMKKTRAAEKKAPEKKEEMPSSDGQAPAQSSSENAAPTTQSKPQAGQAPVAQSAQQPAQTNAIAAQTQSGQAQSTQAGQAQTTQPPNTQATQKTDQTQGQSQPGAPQADAGAAGKNATDNNPKANSEAKKA